MEGSCCECDQEDLCACENRPNNYKCINGSWKIEVEVEVEDDEKGEQCRYLGILGDSSACGGAAGGWEGSCCECDQEDLCACENKPNNFKCIDGFWKIEGKEGSDYGGGGTAGGGVGGGGTTGGGWFPPPDEYDYCRDRTGGGWGGRKKRSPGGSSAREDPCN